MLTPERLNQLLDNTWPELLENRTIEEQAELVEKLREHVRRAVGRPPVGFEALSRAREEAHDEAIAAARREWVMTRGFEWMMLPVPFPTGEADEDGHAEFEEGPYWPDAPIEAIRSNFWDLFSSGQRYLANAMWHRHHSNIWHDAVPIELEAMYTWADLKMALAEGVQSAVMHVSPGAMDSLHRAELEIVEGPGDGATQIWPGKAFWNRPEGVGPEGWVCSPIGWWARSRITVRSHSRKPFS